MNPVRTLVAMLCGLACSAVLVGRARAQDGTVMPLPPEDQQAIDAMLGPGVVGQALPSNPIQDVSVYFPLQERVLSYQVTSGPHAGKTQTLAVARGKRPDGNPAWRFGLSPSLAAFLRQTEQGLIMPAVGTSAKASSS